MIDLNKVGIITDVVVSSDKTELSLITETGIHVFRVYADCCSTSWIEHVEDPDNIIGQKLTKMEEVDGEEFEEDDDCIRTYITRFHSEKGAMELEFRNASNGYYGGSLEYLGMFPHTEVVKND